MTDRLNLRDSDTSKPKRTVTPLCIYVHPAFAHLELSARYDTAKVTIIIETTKLLAKKFRKKLCEGDTIVKRKVSAEHDSSNKRNEAIMIFRRKYASDKEPTITRTYKSFFSKKVSKSHF